mmetsp:Transcript_109879/g.319729  ORF Transcript_109879/g.319729 Transcript_109879/m.319729 type:complete len:260 (-) Transcript_109879:167-946(-)
MSLTSPPGVYTLIPGSLLAHVSAPVACKLTRLVPSPKRSGDSDGSSAPTLRNTLFHARVHGAGCWTRRDGRGGGRSVGASAWAGKVRADEIGRRGAGKVVWLLPRPYRSSKRMTTASTAAGTAPHQPPGEVCSCRNAAIWFVPDPSARATAAADGNRTILGASSPAATFADRYLAAACEHALTIASHSAGVATSSSTMSDSPVASRPAAPCSLSVSIGPSTGPSGSTAACALSMGTSRHAERRPPLLLPQLSPSQYSCM